MKGTAAGRRPAPRAAGSRAAAGPRAGPGTGSGVPRFVLPALLGLLLLATPAAGQAPGDTLRLDALHDEVREIDPRARQLPLRERVTEARLRSLDAGWLPELRLRGEAGYQTDVPTAVSTGEDGALPGGLRVPEPPKDRYEAALRVEQLLYDGGAISRGKSLARARAAEERSEIRASLYGLRGEVDRAFFAALLQQERRRQLELLLEDLESRQETLADRVRAGSLVPAELAAVRAERIAARQRLREAESERRAALDRLSLLLDREVATGTVLSVPELAPLADSLRRSLPAAGPGAGNDGAAVPWSRRPEWQRLARLGERLRAEAALAEAETRPRASAFLEGAYGRPGLDFFDDSFSPYATAGVRVEWSFFDWGGSDAEARARRLRAEMARAEQEALGEALRRRAASALRRIDWLRDALASDDSLVALQEQRRRTALRQLQEGVLLPTEYIERRTDVFEARLRRRQHRVQLAESRARLLRILGRRLSGTPGGLELPLDPPSSPFSLPRPGTTPR